MNKSESIKELATALCKFQGEVEKIKKTTTNPFFKSKYANLADILDVIRQPMADAGLSFVQFPKGQHELETMLMHTSGEWMAETYSMPPTKNDPQGLGSAITYQRRYALGAILGLNIDEDDDGNNASRKPTQQQATPPAPAPIEKKPVTEKQFLGIKQALMSGDAEFIAKGKANFKALTQDPYVMRGEWKSELETIIKTIEDGNS